MNKTPLIAFHGKQEIKDKYLERVRLHREADELVKGKYWENGKGCAVGCTIHSSDHAAYETELGIPRVLARLEDGIFENLENGKSKEWPERFLSSIKVGADLSSVGSKFMIWLLVDPKDGVIRFTKKEKTREAIEHVADLYKQRMSGNEPTPKQWSTSAASADAAAAYAASASADAYAAYAASAYAYAASASADAYAAYAASAAAARKVHYERMADKLIELLKEAV